MKDRHHRNRFQSRLFKLVSVFLSLCVFAVVLMGCGMPNPIGFLSGDYFFDGSYIVDGTKNIGANISLNFTSDAVNFLREDKKITEVAKRTPSLMLFYTFRKGTELHSTNFYTQFRNAYMPSQSSGRNLSFDAIHNNSVLNYTENNEVHYLFPLGYVENATTTIPNAPSYFINPANSYSPVGDNPILWAEPVFSFSIIRQEIPSDPDSVELKLQIKDNTNAIITELTLCRSNGKPFIINTESINSMINDVKSSGEKSDEWVGEGLDYIPLGLVSDSDLLYLQLYIALNFNPVEGTSFNNIYWSPLVGTGSGGSSYLNPLGSYSISINLN